MHMPAATVVLLQRANPQQVRLLRLRAREPKCRSRQAPHPPEPGAVRLTQTRGLPERESHEPVPLRRLVTQPGHVGTRQALSLPTLAAVPALSRSFDGYLGQGLGLFPSTAPGPREGLSVAVSFASAVRHHRPSLSQLGVPFRALLAASARPPDREGAKGRGRAEPVRSAPPPADGPAADRSPRSRGRIFYLLASIPDPPWHDPNEASVEG